MRLLHFSTSADITAYQHLNSDIACHDDRKTENESTKQIYMSNKNENSNTIELNIGLNIFNCSSEKNLDANESEEHEESPAEDTTNSTKKSTPQTSEVVAEKWNVRPCKRSKSIRGPNDMFADAGKTTHNADGDSARKITSPKNIKRE